MVAVPKNAQNLGLSKGTNYIAVALEAAESGAHYVLKDIPTDI